MSPYIPRKGSITNSSMSIQDEISDTTRELKNPAMAPCRKFSVESAIAAFAAGKLRRNSRLEYHLFIFVISSRMF